MQRAKNTIRQAIEASKYNQQHTRHYTLFSVAAQEVYEAASYGLDIAGYAHVIDGSAIRHIFI